MSVSTKNIYGDKPIQRTDHPHIVKVDGVCGGEPIILGTRMMVRTIIWHYRTEGSIEEVLWAFPHLSSAQVHDALSYFHDHREEMDLILEQATYEYWQPKIQRMQDERAKGLSNG